MGLSNDHQNMDPGSILLQAHEEWDVASDQDLPIDDKEPGAFSRNSASLPSLETEGVWDDGLIGISISRHQTHMRSPETPIAEKAKALNLAPEYAQMIDTVVEDEASEDHGDLEIDVEVPSHLQTSQGFLESQKSPLPTNETAVLPVPDATAGPDATQYRQPNRGTEEVTTSLSKLSPPSPWRSDAIVNQKSSSQGQPQISRQSITKSFLNSAGDGGRRRASSGPTAILNNLRKYIPDLPSPSFGRSSLSLAFSNSKNAESDPSTTSTTPTEKARFKWPTFEAPERQVTLDSRQERVLHNLITESRPHQLDGNVESLLEPRSPRSLTSIKSRVRSNSESSLYIGRRISNVSAYDDTSAFADVSEMVNSRFKAITDSFQNSTLKLPRMPTIRPSPKRRISPEELSTSSDHIDDNGKAHSHYYTSIKNLRAANKGLDLETSQQRAHPILSHALSKLTGDVVVLGGYRGSILRSAKPPHRQLWVPIKVGLNLRKVDLEVGLTREDEENMEQTIIPSGVLSHIGPIDICRRLLKHLSKCPNAREGKLRVHNWGYDWRLSPDLLSRQFVKFLQSLESNHPETPVNQRGATIIAHSLGGLITRHAVNQRPELFAGVIYAGTPQNCVNILGPMRNGDDVLLSSRVLTAQVNFTIRTSFVLLPDDGHCFIQKHTNKKYPLDFFDPQVWEDFHLSPCINSAINRSNRDGDRRKSLIGQLSDSLPSRPSWLNGQPAQSSEAKPVAEVHGTLQSVRNGMEENTEEMVGPSLKSAQHNKPSVATAVTIPKDVAKEYLARTLREIKAFRQELKFIPSHQKGNLYPPHGYIFGKSVPTVHSARVTDMEAIKYDDAFDDLAFAAGDGVVLASAAQLPEGYRCVKGGRVETDRGHVGLLGDLEGVGRCLEAVIEARSKGVGLGQAFGRPGSD